MTVGQSAGVPCRAFTIAATISAVLWAAVVASWVAGYGHDDQWIVQSVLTPSPGLVRYSSWSISGGDGTLTFFWGRTQASVLPGPRTTLHRPHDRMPGDGVHWLHVRRDTARPTNTFRPSSPDPPRWWNSDFQVQRPRTIPPGKGETQRVAFISCPHWAVAGPLTVLPLVWAARRQVRRRRDLTGRCRRCGYDLRASPARCPECGAAAPTTHSMISAGGCGWRSAPSDVMRSVRPPTPRAAKTQAICRRLLETASSDEPRVRTAEPRGSAPIRRHRRTAAGCRGRPA